MDRPSLRYGISVALLLGFLALGSSGGCTGVFTTMMLLMKGTDAEPDFKYLKGKTVAVVVQQTADLDYPNHSVPGELAKNIGLLLRAQVQKIKVIDQQKVANWCDDSNNDIEDIEKLGKDLKADMVVKVELGAFSLFQGQTIYLGKAETAIQVVDCRSKEKRLKDKELLKKEDDDSRVVFEKTLPQTIFPPVAGGVSTTSMSEPEFRNRFIKALADQIGRHFYPHDRHADLMQDSSVL